MTKVEAIVAVLKENNGVGSWRYIYDNIERYYPAAKVAQDWDAGIRGVLYREMRNGKTFKKVGVGVFALAGYKEDQAKKAVTDTIVRKHAYIESLLVELGNEEGFLTHCADPSAMYLPGVPVRQLTSMKELPDFTYPEIVQVAKRIDVLWFTKGKQGMPRKGIEVVDSIGTLEKSLNRLLVLKEFQCNFIIAAPQVHIRKIEKILNQPPYAAPELRERFALRTYEEIEAYHKNLLETEKNKF